MDALLEHLAVKLRQWPPETAEQVRDRIAEIIQSADQGVLNYLPCRQAEQEVLDILDNRSHAGQ